MKNHSDLTKVLKIGQVIRTENINWFNKKLIKDYGHKAIGVLDEVRGYRMIIDKTLITECQGKDLMIVWVPDCSCCHTEVQLPDGKRRYVDPMMIKEFKNEIPD